MLQKHKSIIMCDAQVLEFRYIRIVRRKFPRSMLLNFASIISMAVEINETSFSEKLSWRPSVGGPNGLF